MVEKCLISECKKPISKLVIVYTSRKSKDGIVEVEKQLWLCAQCATEIIMKLEKSPLNKMGFPVKYEVLNINSRDYETWLKKP